MSREQKKQPLLAKNAMGWWLSPLVLAIAVLLLPATIPSVVLLPAAHAETDSEEQSAEAQSSESDSSEAETESETRAKEQEANEGDAKQQDDKASGDVEKKSDQKGEQSDSTDKPAEEEKKSEEKAMDSEESKSKSNGESKSDDKATVEIERSEEVEPPKDTPKGDGKSTESTEKPKKEKYIIGASATLLEKQSELKFRARVDSGAKSCSLHVEEIRIEDESKKEGIAERMTENIGKVIHFEVKNGDKKSHILTSKIAGYVIIKNSNKAEGKRRYKVPLTFRWKHMEKEVLVTLTDRNHMEYPLLLGRNFLRGDFLVDVELDSDD